MELKNGLKKLTMNKNLLFTINTDYKKTDIYRLLNVPKSRQGGSWNKGHINFKVSGNPDQHFIFANIGKGKGYDGKEFEYDNSLNDKNQLIWVTENRRAQHNPIMQSLITSNPYIFIRKDGIKGGFWTYKGTASLLSIKNNNPVNIIWQINDQSFLKNINNYTILDNLEVPNDNIHDINLFARKVRKGQSKFRSKLLKLYNNTCAITNCNIVETLDAGHIYSHSKSGINHSKNGILLRSDIHNLFDKHLIKINPNTFKVEISTKLNNSEYEQYDGKTINKTIAGQYPDKIYLKKQYLEEK